MDSKFIKNSNFFRSKLHVIQSSLFEFLQKRKQEAKTKIEFLQIQIRFLSFRTISFTDLFKHIAKSFFESTSELKHFLHKANYGNIFHISAFIFKFKLCNRPSIIMA